MRKPFCLMLSSRVHSNELVYAKTFLPDAVVMRPLEGAGPKIDLSIGYRSANTSPTLELFLSRAHELASQSPLRVAADW
jgi:LysR family hca operon transcriptional activator